MNGFLSVHEYVACLKDSDLGLEDFEIITLSMSADINGDGRIDYEEFMKHFTQNLRMIRFHHSLQEAYTSYKASTAPMHTKSPAKKPTET